jgi:periplasmic protein TonB
MSGGSRHRIETISERENDRGTGLEHLVPRRAEDALDSAAPPIAITNVVPFTRPRRDADSARTADAILADPAKRPMPQQAKDRRAWFVAFLTLSLLVHGGVFLLFNREPEPMASIGLEAISVEIVLGANMPAGVAMNPGESEAQSAPANDPDPVPTDTETATAKVEDAKEAKPVDDARPVQVETRVDDAKPVETATVATETPPERTEPQQRVAAIPLDTTPAPREPELAAAPAEPVPEELAVLAPPQPKEAEPAKPETVPVQVVPAVQRQPVEKREPKPKTQREAKPKTDRQPKAKQDRPTRTASTDPNATGPRANAASGVGPGRSQNDSNYRGLVAAHLARHKRFPADARARGDQGTATISFSLDGGGRVTRVALVRGTGFAGLDQEVQGMVRRASPFPAPPDGRGMSFTVPVSFRIQ